MDGRVEHSGGIQASLAGRYARALFDLAEEAKSLTAVQTSVTALGTALTESDTLRDLLGSPVISRFEAGKAVAALASKLKLDALTTKFIGVLAENRRLDKLAEIVSAFAGMAAAHRGEISADVTSAHPLSAAQVTDLKATLKSRLGRDAVVNLHVDPAILGGLVVRVGSRQIDSSIRTRLNTLAAAMKG